MLPSDDFKSASARGSPTPAEQLLERKQHSAQYLQALLQPEPKAVVTTDGSLPLHSTLERIKQELVTQTVLEASILLKSHMTALLTCDTIKQNLTSFFAREACPSETVPAFSLSAPHTMPVYAAHPSGGNSFMMSKYTDLSKPPVSLTQSLDELTLDLDSPVTDKPSLQEFNHFATPPNPVASISTPQPVVIPPAKTDAFNMTQFAPEFTLTEPNVAPDIEFSTNVRTLIRLVNDLPEGVTKQTGAQIIRLTMEAMGIQIQEVLNEAQTAQNEMLEKARTNLRKIEDLKAQQSKLERDIRNFQGKATELSETIDLFILSSQNNG